MFHDTVIPRVFTKEVVENIKHKMDVSRDKTLGHSSVLNGL